jgi:hypothetical protein
VRIARTPQTNSVAASLLALCLLPATACVEPAPVPAPESWWNGPGAELEPTSFAGDDGSDGSPPMFRPHTLLAFEDNDRLVLSHVARWRASAEVEIFGDAVPGARIVGMGSVLAILTPGSVSTFAAGAFDPEQMPDSHQLPPGADPLAFLMGNGCALLALQGTRQVLVIQDNSPETATIDLDDDITSAVAADRRLFVGLASPSGGAVLEVGCSGETWRREVASPVTLLGATTEGMNAYVRVHGEVETVHVLDPDGETPLGREVSVTDLGALAVAPTGELWAAGAALRCHGPEGAFDAGEIDGEAVAMAVDGRGDLSLIDVASGGAVLRTLGTEGCAVDGEDRLTLDSIPVDLGVVIRVVTGRTDP